MSQVFRTLHHLCIVVHDVEKTAAPLSAYAALDVPDCDAAEQAGFAQGLAPLMRGRRADRSGFTFFDTAREAGIVLEVRSSPAPSAKA